LRDTIVTHGADELAISNEGVRTTSPGIVEDLANAKQQSAVGHAYVSLMKMIESLKPFPLRTLVVCFTIWLIATEALFFDQLKFNTRVEVLEQTARAFRGPEVIAPTQRAFNFPGGGNAEKL
jgi:hypothetical protein